MLSLACFDCSACSLCLTVSECEGVRLEEGVLDTLMRASGGDMRKALTFLQSSHQLSGGGAVDMRTVLDISGQVLHPTYY